MESTTIEERRLQEEVMNLALNRGGAASVAAFLGTGIGVYVAHMKHAGFRKNFGVSGKSALPIMAALFAGSLVTELYMFDAKRNPEEYGLRPYANGASPAPKKYTAPLHHKIFNGIHDKPFYFVTAAGIPLAGKILMDRLNKPHLSLSQAILQSRVMAQFGVLSIVLTTMYTRYYVAKNGRFPDDE